MKKSHNFLLPDVINPTETVCIRIEVPKDDKHIYAFWGALDILGRANNWEWDGLQSGKAAAKIWRNVIETARTTWGNCDMPLDCNEVESCLSTSAIISAIQGDIAALQGVDSNLQSQIDDNDTDISNLQGRMTAAESAIAQHTLDIAQNISDIADNLLSINQHQLTLNDHEARLTAHENSPHNQGGGGSGTPIEVITKHLIDDHTFAADFASHSIDIPVEYDDLEIHIFARTNDATKRWINASFNDDLVNTNYTSFSVLTGAAIQNVRRIGRPSNHSAADEPASSNLIIRIPHIQDSQRKKLWSEYTSQNNDNQGAWHGIEHLYWENNAPITKVAFDMETGHKFDAGSRIVVYGYKKTDVYADIPPPTDVITFDAGGANYSFGAGNDGTIDTNGNPDNCLQSQALADGDELSVMYDFGSSVTVDEWTFDYFTNDHALTQIELWVDSVNVLIIGATASNAWTQFFYGANQTGQNFEWRIKANGGALTDVRIDNIDPLLV